MDLSQPLEYEFKYLKRGEIKSSIIDYDGDIESCFVCGLVDHKFDVCPKLEKKIGIKIEKKVPNSYEAVGDFESTVEKDPSLKETKSRVEV